MSDDLRRAAKIVAAEHGLRADATARVIGYLAIAGAAAAPRRSWIRRVLDWLTRR